MAAEEVDALLARMAQIAEAVNAFKSESVQAVALEALLVAFQDGRGHGKTVAKTEMAQQSSAVADEQEEPEEKREGNGSRKRRRGKQTGGSRGAVQPVRDLNLRPAGRESFDDFVAMKNPRDNQERFATAVYYLEEIAGIGPITLSHLAAVFKQTAGWREPGNLHHGVRMTAVRKNTIDTSDWENLRTTPHGRNFVEHDLPRKADKKSK